MLFLFLLVGLALAENPIHPCDADEWYDNGICYFFGPMLLSRGMAGQYCRNRNSQLVVLDTAEAQNFVEFNSRAIPLVWMGLRCKASNPAACFWDNLKPLPLGFSNFGPGHPNIQQGECVTYEGLSDQGYWMSTPCDKETYFVCNRPSRFKLPPRVALPDTN